MIVTVLNAGDQPITFPFGNRRAAFVRIEMEDADVYNAGGTAPGNGFAMAGAFAAVTGISWVEQILWSKGVFHTQSSTPLVTINVAASWDAANQALIFTNLAANNPNYAQDAEFEGDNSFLEGMIIGS